MAKRLVAWIEAERERRGWSLRRLAREAGLTPAQVSEVLSGYSRPGIRFYLGMWRAFHVSVDYLLQLAGELPRRLPAELQENLRRYCAWRFQQAGAIDAANQATSDYT